MTGEITKLVRTLVAVGATPEQILAAVETTEATKDAAIETSREKARARTRGWWERLGLTAAEWRDLSNAVKLRDNYTCGYCGSTEEPLHVDHMMPLLKGGTNDPGNLVTACRECNCGKSGRTPEEWQGGK